MKSLPLLLLALACLGLLLNGCAQIGRAQRNGQKLLDAALPGQTEVVAARSNRFASFDYTVTARSLEDPDAVFNFVWDPKKPKEPDASTLQQAYRQARRWAENSRELAGVLRAHGFDGARARITGPRGWKPFLNIIVTLPGFAPTDDNRAAIVSRLHNALLKWRVQYLAKEARAASSDLQLSILMTPAPAAPDAGMVLPFGAEALDFTDSKYSLWTDWERLRSAEGFGARLALYAWDPEVKQWREAAIAAAHAYARTEPRLAGCRLDDDIVSDPTLSPQGINRVRFYVGVPGGIGAPGCNEKKFGAVALTYHRDSGRFDEYRLIENLRKPEGGLRVPYEDDWQ